MNPLLSTNSFSFRATLRRGQIANRDASGFSMIEMIGVLAIIAIVATILTPNIARRVSRQNGDREDEALSVLGDGLVRYARNYQSVPGSASWVTNISAMTGLSVNDVRYVRPSDTNTLRVYLVHPSFYPTNSSTADPLFTQGTAGASSVTNARIIILSTHKSEMILPVTSGRATSTAVFDAIWNWYYNPTTKAPPSGWSSTWNNCGEYLHVQRVNLVPLFSRVTFSNASFPSAYPSIQVGTVTTSLSSTSAIDMFFMQGTYLRLYKDSGVGGGLDVSQCIDTPVNFLYESGSWRIP